VSCKVSVDGYVDKVQAGYVELVIEKCAELRRKAEEELVNKERGEQIERKCLDTAGADMERDTEAQKRNYTTMCIHAIMNGSNSTFVHLRALVTDFWEGQNLTGDLQDLVGQHLNKTFTDILDEYSGSGGSRTTSAESGSSADDASGSNSTSGSESGSSARNVSSSNSSGSESVGSAGVSSGSSNETGSGSRDPGAILKLLEDSAIQWRASEEDSSHSRSMLLTAAASGLVVLLGAALGASALRAQKRRRSIGTWRALGCDQEAISE